MRIFIALLFLLNSIAPAFATTGIPDSRNWEPIGFGGGGSYSMILPDNTTANKLYMISDVNDPWKSTDLGENWTQMPNVGWKNGFTSYITQSPTDPLTLWSVGSGTYLFNGVVEKSKDGGDTWQPMKFLNVVARGNQVIFIDPADDDHVFVAAGGDVYETTDEGLNWVKRVTKPFSSRLTGYTTKTACENAGAGWNSTLNQCTSLTINFVYYDENVNDLIIGSGSTRVGSSSFGMTRYDLDTDTQSFIDLTGTNAKRNFSYDTYFDGATRYFCTTAGRKIACSSDYTTWNYTVTDVYWDTNYFFEHFVIDKLGGGNIRVIGDARSIVSEYVRLFKRSVDNGATWTTISKILAPTSINPTNAWSGGGGNCFSITKDHFDINKIYMTNNWAGWISTDGGITFSEKTKGAQNVVVNDIDVAPNGRIFTTMSDVGIMYKDTGSSTWVSVFPNSTYPQYAWGGHAWRILCAGTLAEWNAGTGVVVATYTTYQPGRYYWTYVLRSTNNGTTFTPILIVDKQMANGLWGDGYPRGLAMSADQNTMYLSLDGDNCTYNASLPADCPGVTPPPYDNWITGGIFISRDKGATWARSNGHARITELYQARRIFNALAVDPSVTSGNTVLFGAWGYQNSWRSLVAGSTDTQDPTTGWGYTSSTDWIRDMKFGSDAVPVITGTEGGLPVVYRSISTIYGNQNGSWGTWQKMTTFPNDGTADALEIDSTNTNRMFVSTVEGTSLKGNQKVYATFGAKKGNAASWTDITGNLPQSGCDVLKINKHEGDDGYLLCGSHGGGVLKLDMTSSTSLHPGKVVIGGSSIE